MTECPLFSWQADRDQALASVEANAGRELWESSICELARRRTVRRPSNLFVPGLGWVRNEAPWVSPTGPEAAGVITQSRIEAATFLRATRAASAGMGLTACHGPSRRQGS
jgi:hypothetical protein